MAKSRWMLAGLVVAAPGWTQAPAVTAEDAMAHYRTAFPTTAKLDCPDPAPGEIIVCGRRRGEGERDPNRLPLPGEPEPGARTEMLPGEPPRADAGARETCSTSGPNQQCGGGLPVFAIAKFVADVIVKGVIDPEE